MSRVAGVFLVIAGLGVAAYQLSAGYEPRSRSVQDAESARNPPTATITLAAVSEPERIAPPPAAKPAPAASRLRAAAQAQVPGHADAINTIQPPPMAAQPSQPWPPYITHAQRENDRVRLAQAMPQMQRPEMQRPGILPIDRATLARDLQRELTRVGCYGGEINSTWTMSTKRAMKAFMDRVNATLPIEEPDQVLLALVKSHSDNVCGKPCPPGQGLSDAGRCLPNAILARAATKGSARALAGSAPKGKTPEPPSWATTATVPAPRRPMPALAAPVQHEPAPEGRMALAGPHGEGSSLPPAAPMSSEGVSVLPAPNGDAAPPPAAGAYEPRRAPRQAQGGGSWSRSFYKRRDSIF